MAFTQAAHPAEEMIGHAPAAGGEAKDWQADKAKAEAMRIVRTG